MAQNLTFNLAVDSNAAVQSINQFFDTFDQGAAQASNKLRKAFNEPIKTEVEISLKNGELIAKKIESSKNKSKQLKDVFKALNGEIGKTPNALKKQMSILKSLQGNTKKYKDGTNRLSAEWKKVEERIRRVKAEQDKLTGGSGGGGGMNNFIGKFAMVQTMANLATSAIMGLGRQVGELAATGVRMESLMLQLEAFAGGAAQADAVYKKFADTARKTPFNVEEVAQAGKIMMAFGVDAETATEMTDRLGIVAAATGGDLNNMGRNLGQIAAQGQAYTRDLHQFAMQGVPIWEEMSKVTGKSVVELKKLASEGKISFEIVSAALKNLTKEGGAFAIVANRMQEVFAGRMAAIQTALVNLALGMIDAFNNMDQAMGKVMTGAMTSFAEALEELAKNLPAIGHAMGQTMQQIGSIFSFIGNIFTTVGGWATSASGWFFKLLGAITPVDTALRNVGGTIGSLLKPLQDAGLLLAALAGPAIVVGIGLVIKSIYGMMTATYAYIKAQIISLGLSGPAGWFVLAGAAAATAGAYLMLRGNLSQANQEMAKSKAEQDANAQAARENAGAQDDLKVSIDGTAGAMKGQADAAKLVAKEAKAAYDKQKEKSDALKESILARIDEEKAAVQELIDVKKAAIDREKEAYKTLTEETKRRYDQELESVRTLYDEKLRAMDLERDALQSRTPAEEKLRQLQKEELEDKLRKSGLEEKERLELQARLERMERQEQMEKLSAERKKVELEKTREIERIEKEKKDTLEAQKKAHKENLDSLETELETHEKAMESLKKQEDGIKKMVSGVKAYNGELNVGINALDAQLKRTATLEEAYKRLARLAEEASIKAAQAKADTETANQNMSGSSSDSGSQPTTRNFAGGGIAAGTTSWVNELGKEAFLSASGKLSMINDTHGKWTAPSDGTIIPAHLTKRLDIPTGGVNLNSAASSNASRASSGGMASMVKAIRASMGGDTFNQSVTVQSSNPTQTANNMMVEMTRLKRRRFG